ncbi:MAG TPA: response regulator transcription factor [Anaerolineae bacterium]
MSDVILAIDDDVEFLDYLRLNLERFGHQVVTATDGLTGVALAADLQPDLITLDIMMPCMDGWEACRRIREVSDAPILMLTAMGRVKDVTRGLDMGADGYLVKPFNTRELLARMKALRRRVALVHA